MSDLIVKVDGNHVAVRKNNHILSGATGLTASVTLDDTWEDLTVTVSFRIGSTEYTALSSATGIYTIPHELLVASNIGKMLEIGITGTDGDDEVYPTTYCFCGRVEEGCDGEAGPSEEPTPTYYQQVLTLATKCKTTMEACTATATALPSGSNPTVEVDVDYDDETMSFAFGIPGGSGTWGTITGTLSNQTDLQSALDAKVSTETGKGLSTNDYTTAEKTKLAGIEAEANKTVVDSAMSSTSENPVQNKVVQSALDGMPSYGVLRSNEEKVALMHALKWASSTAYAVGDYVVVDELEEDTGNYTYWNLYKCRIAHTSASSWTLDQGSVRNKNWTSVKATDEIKVVQSALASKANLTDIIDAEEYDSTSTYEYGDFCLHNGHVYYAIADITTPEAFDEDKWHQYIIYYEMWYALDNYATLDTVNTDDGNVAKINAPAWASNTAYAVGDYVVYNAYSTQLGRIETLWKLYRCTTAHTSGAKFASAYFTEVTTTSLIKALNPFTVTLTKGDEGYTKDKTNAEIYTAYQAGQTIVAYMSYENQILPATSVTSTKAEFGNIYGYNSLDEVWSTVLLIENDVVSCEVYAMVKSNDLSVYRTAESQNAIDALKQPITDETLETTSKTVPGAVNELKESLADKQSTANLVTAVSSSSTDSQYPSAKCLYNTVDDAVGDVAGRVETVEGEVGNINAHLGFLGNNDVVGIQVDYENKTFTRLASAVGKTAGSDFDSFLPFGGRRRCNVADDGTINAYYGDEDYTEDGTNGQVMVYQPKFYYLVTPIKFDKNTVSGIGYHLRKANYYVSPAKYTGFKVHPAFIDANGNEVDYILFSAYEGSMWDASQNKYINDSVDESIAYAAGDLLCSVAGKKPISGLRSGMGTKTNFEAMANNRGSGWHLETIQATSANQLLMIIELGMMNTQTGIGQGVVSITDNSSYNCSSLVGSTASLGNGTGSAASTINEQGGTETTYTVSGKVSITYRGVENPWGNMWKHIQGVNLWGDGTMAGGQPYICDDLSSFNESSHSGHYHAAGFTLANAYGYINAMGYGNPDFDWLLMPSEIGGSSSLPVGDYLYVTINLNGYRIAQLGGGWYNDTIAGAFYWICAGGVGCRVRGLGGRLVYVPAQ